MRHYIRDYDAQLASFVQERIRREEVGYRDYVKVFVSSLVARGENVAHIANSLDVSQETIIRWYHDIFLNQEDLVFGINDFTYIREKNKIKADARTKGCIVKAIVEETMDPNAAAEAVGVSGPQVVKNWVNEFRRDYDLMTTLPAGVEYKIRTSYAYKKEHAEQLQALILEHDRQENELSSRLKTRAIEERE